MRPPTEAERLSIADLPGEAFVAECPGCGTIAPYLGPTGCLEDWDGETYRFKCCGHRAHLDPSTGGARTGVDDAVLVA